MTTKRSSLDRPTLVAPTSEQHALWGTAHHGYHRAYTVHAAAGLCQLQRVRVHIQYHCGRELLADYRQTYYECFAFDHEQASVVDTHDFDLMRDGWRQSVISGLLKQHRATGASQASGEPRLSVKKQFLLGKGLVEDGAARQIHPGAHFGLLANGRASVNGPSNPSNTSLRIARGNGTWHTIHTLPACPAGYEVAGTGTFLTSSGLRAFEHFRFRFASMAGTFNDRGQYTPHCIH